LTKQLKRDSKRNTLVEIYNKNFSHLLLIFKDKYIDLTPFRTPAI